AYGVCYTMSSYQKNRYAVPLALFGLLGCRSSESFPPQQPSLEQRSAIVAYIASPSPGPAIPPVPAASQDLVSQVQGYLTERNTTAQLRAVMPDLYTASLLPLPPQVGNLRSGLYVCSPEPLSTVAHNEIRDLLKHYGDGARAYRAYLDGKTLHLEEIR
ncbi:MAG: hypothetical protein AABW64_00495, partial [Nanoarchaeota archaeon]